MNISRILRSLPLKKQTVIKALLLATLLFIVYQLTFVAELNESAKAKPLRERFIKHDKGRISRIHPKDISLVEKNIGNEKTKGEVVVKKEEHIPSKSKEQISSEVHKQTSSNVKEQNLNNNEKLVSSDTKGQNVMEKPKSSVVMDTKVQPIEGFTCRTSGKVITQDKVNDDYCDCPEDGSDEPRTNACTNSKFSCTKTVKGFPDNIPSAWVNDGVCDCCDGSDEWEKKVMDIFLPLQLQEKVGQFLSPCPNHCP